MTAFSATLALVSRLYLGFIGRLRGHRFGLGTFFGKNFDGISETTFHDADGVTHQVATLDSWVITFVV